MEKNCRNCHKQTDDTRARTLTRSGGRPLISACARQTYSTGFAQQSSRPRLSPVGHKSVFRPPVSFRSFLVRVLSALLISDPSLARPCAHVAGGLALPSVLVSSRSLHVSQSLPPQAIAIDWPEPRPKRHRCFDFDAGILLLTTVPLSLLYQSLLLRCRLAREETWQDRGGRGPQLQLCGCQSCCQSVSLDRTPSSNTRLFLVSSEASRPNCGTAPHQPRCRHENSKEKIKGQRDSKTNCKRTSFKSGRVECRKSKRGLIINQCSTVQWDLARNREGPHIHHPISSAALTRY